MIATFGGPPNRFEPHSNQRPRSRIGKAMRQLTAQGYDIVEGPAFRNVFGSPTPCVILRSPKGDEEVATFTTADTDNPILGIYPRSLTNL